MVLTNQLIFLVNIKTMRKILRAILSDTMMLLSAMTPNGFKILCRCWEKCFVDIVLKKAVTQCKVFFLVPQKRVLNDAAQYV